MNTNRVWNASSGRCITASADGPGMGRHYQFAVMERTIPVAVNRKVEL